MQGQGLDDGRRRRSIMSMMAVSALTLCAVSSLMFIDAMKIDRVSAPESVRALEWSLFEPPPPSPPPPRLGGAVQTESDADETSPPDTPRPRRPSPAPSFDSEPAPADPGDARPRVPGNVGGGAPGPGLPDGVQGGLGGVPCPGCSGDGPISTPTVRRSPPPPPKPVPFEQLACRVCPDPDPKRLARTRPALTGARGGRSVVAFCVDERGQAFDVRTQKSFGDGEVDRIAVQTVKRWRFAPMRAGKKTRKVCSSVSFDIEFR